MSLRTGSLLSISAISLLITSPVIADLVFSTSKSDFDKVLDIPSDVWDKAIIGMAVNATNDSEIKGKNMTLPYGPAAPDSVGWEYSIHVRDDIPAPNGLGFITGVELRTHGPYDEARPLPTNESILTVPMHPSWDICRLVWAGPNLRSDTPISGPGCKGFLPDDCIADLKQQLKDTGRGACPLPQVSNFPESCAGKRWDDATGFSSALRTEYPDDPNWYPGKQPLNPGKVFIHTLYDFIKYAIDIRSGHKAGDKTAYEEALKRVYVIGHIWGYSQASGLDNSTAVSAEVTCLQAEDIVNQSGWEQDPEPEQEEDLDGQGGDESAAGLSFRLAESLVLMVSLVVLSIVSVSW